MRIHKTPLAILKVVPFFYIILLPAQAFGWSFSGSGDRYLEYCLLDRYSSVANDITARSVYSSCNHLPSIKTTVPGRFEFRHYSDQRTCSSKYASKTTSNLAAKAANRVCGTITAPSNRRGCALLIDDFISSRPGLQQFSRSEVWEWMKNTQDQRIDGFSSHCL